jgi:hypothetical protein
MAAELMKRSKLGVLVVHLLELDPREGVQLRAFSARVRVKLYPPTVLFRLGLVCTPPYLVRVRVQLEYTRVKRWIMG